MISAVKFIAASVLLGTLSVGLARPLLAQSASHAPHEGRYGGAFATAAADSLHVEAVWSEQRRIRLFVTDASGNVLRIERLRGIEATAIADSRESAAVLIEIDRHFEARVPTLRLPAAISVRFKASPESPGELLQFTFDDYSQQIDPSDRPAPAEIPDTLAGILRALEEDRQALHKIFAEGIDAGRMLPIEDRVRDHVLAIEPYLEPLTGARRSGAEYAITRVVRSCWLLHTVMDHGNDAQLAAALTEVNDALTRLQASVSGLTR
jgi:hypothetical protein